MKSTVLYSLTDNCDETELLTESISFNGSDGSSDEQNEYDSLVVVKPFEVHAPSLQEGYWEKFVNYISPSDVPREVQLWLPENIAVPMSYLLVGTFQGLAGGIMTVYLLQLGATEAQQMTIKNLSSLPATCKLLFGFLSDTSPLWGYRRKSYMLLGWAISSVGMIGLASNDDSQPNSIPLIALFYFIFGFGFWMADVIADSVMAERAKLEPEHHRGQLQSLCYACRFFMLMVTITIATCLYDYIHPRVMFCFMAALPWFTVMPAIYFLHETPPSSVKRVAELCGEVWTTVCSRAVWQPMGFVYLYILLQVTNAAWSQYMYSTLHFSSVQINSFMVVTYILLYVGIMLYKLYFIKWSWHWIYIISTCLNLLFSGMQILLILRVNRRLGVSDYFFALGDEAMTELVYGIQYLPTMIMMAHLCPVGSEGTSFALFTSVNNSALMLSQTISTLLLPIWDVSKETLEKGNTSGILNLTLLTTAIQTFAIVFLPLLPKGINQLKSLNFAVKSSVGGAVFLTVVFASILWTMTCGVLNVVAPGWSGES